MKFYIAWIKDGWLLLTELLTPDFLFFPHVETSSKKINKHMEGNKLRSRDLPSKGSQNGFTSEMNSHLRRVDLK